MDVDRRAEGARGDGPGGSSRPRCARFGSSCAPLRRRRVDRGWDRASAEGRRGGEAAGVGATVYRASVSPSSRADAMKCARDARERRPRDGGEDALAVDFTGGDGVTSVFLGGLLFGGPILGRSCRVRPVRGATAECPCCCFSCVSASERAAWKISVGGWAVWLDRGRIEISETRKCFLWFENKCFTGTRTVIERVEP